MKKIIKYLVIMIMFMLPFMVNAKENVEITQVKLYSKTTTSEVGTSTFDGLTVNFDVKFTQADDEVVYKLTIKNKDNKDYELEKGEMANSSKHIKYTIDYSGSSIIKANSTKEATVSIKYFNLVNDNEFVNVRFVDTNKVVINLRNETNPQTSTTGLILVILMLLLLGSFVLYKTTPRTKLVSVMVLALLLPLGVLAASKLQIIINAKIEIINDTKFCILDNTFNETYYKYTPGMTVETYCQSSNTSDICKATATKYFLGKNIISCYKSSEEKSGVTSSRTAKAQNTTCYDQYPNEISDVQLTDQIKDKSQGCYVIHESTPGQIDPNDPSIGGLE